VEKVNKKKERLEATHEQLKTLSEPEKAKETWEKVCTSYRRSHPTLEMLRTIYSMESKSDAPNPFDTEDEFLELNQKTETIFRRMNTLKLEYDALCKNHSTIVSSILADMESKGPMYQEILKEIKFANSILQS